MRPLLLLAVLATPALAQEPLSAEEFEAMVEGRTLTYGTLGEPPYGIEHYHPDRRVTWAFLGTDQCIEGKWHAEGPEDSPAICFVYVDDPVPHCWHFFRDGDALRAEVVGEDGSSSLVLYELAEEGALVCGGVGV